MAQIGLRSTWVDYISVSALWTSEAGDVAEVDHGGAVEEQRLAGPRNFSCFWEVEDSPSPLSTLSAEKHLQPGLSDYGLPYQRMFVFTGEEIENLSQQSPSASSDTQGIITDSAEQVFIEVEIL